MSILWSKHLKFITHQPEDELKDQTKHTYRLFPPTSADFFSPQEAAWTWWLSKYRRHTEPQVRNRRTSGQRRPHKFHENANRCVLIPKQTWTPASTSHCLHAANFGKTHIRKSWTIETNKAAGFYSNKLTTSMKITLNINAITENLGAKDCMKMDACVMFFSKWKCSKVKFK